MATNGIQMRSIALLIVLCLPVESWSQRLETVVQRGHYESIKSVAFTPDGQYLLTGSRDKTIKLWELSTGRELRAYLGHESTINDLVILPGGKHFMSSSADKTAKMWDLQTGQLLKTFTGHTDYLTSVAVSPGGQYLLTAGFDWEAILWDIQSGQELRRFKARPDKGIGYGIDAEFSPDGTEVALGSDNRSVFIHNLQTAEERIELKPSEGYCGGCGTFVEYMDGKVLSASNNGDLKLWDPSTGETIQLFYTNPDEFTALDYDGQSKVLVTTTDSLKVYDTHLGQELWSIKVDTQEEITDARFSPDGKLIALANDDKVARIFDAADGTLQQVLSGFLNRTDKGGLNYNPALRWDYYIKRYTDLKNDIKISPDGRYLVKGKLGNIARVWDYKNGKVVMDLVGHEKAVLTMEFSKDGKTVLTGSADNTAKLWEVATGRILMTFKGHREVIFTVAFSEDNTKIATGSWDGTAKIWDVETGKLLETLVFEQASPYQLEFMNNDIYLLIAGLDKTLKLWEIDSKSEVRNFIGHTDVIHSFDIHPGKKSLVSTSWDGKIKLWDLATGLQTLRWSDHRGPTYDAIFSHEGTMLATTGADRVIKLRDPAGKVLKTFEGHTAPVTDLQFTPGDRYLISAAENGEIKTWDVEKGTELVSYILLDRRDWMVVNSDGHFNATEGAFQNIIFVKGMQSYSIDQFFDEFYKPGLLKNVFSTRGAGPLNMLQKMERSPPPAVEIITPADQTEFNSQTAEILFKVIDQGGGAKRVDLFHNGKKAMSQPLQLKHGKSQVIQHTLTLVEGVNVVQVAATSQGNIESAKERIHLRFGGSLKSTLYLYAVGINKYRNKALNLNYASADAQGFVDLIRDHSEELFDHVEIITRYDEDATKENILGELEELSKKIRPQDVLFFFYAGHGSMIDNDFYFIPTENTKLYSGEKLAKTGIYAGELQEKLKSIAALKQVMIIDACQSGGGVELLAQRGATEEKALAQLSRSAGIHVLAAAGSEQFATEFKELGHGLFTYVLLEALSGKADGAPKDGKVTIYELKSYLDDQVPEFSRKYKGKMQFPHTFSRGQDFPIVVE